MKGAAALVREPSPRLADAELTHLARRPVDLALARRQHTGYVELLRSSGRDLVWAPPLPDHPDGVFVEDLVVVVADLAIVTRPGAVSRRGEAAGLADVLSGRGLRVVELEAPARLDGGDVLQVGRTVFVGRTSRTDDAGLRRLADLVAPMGRRVTPVEVRGALHLKTAATALPDGTIVADPSAVAATAFAGSEVLMVPEPAGADLLLLDDEVVVSAAAPRTVDLLTDRGVTVHPVDITEFEKIEAGPTCLSVLLPPAG